MRFVLNDPYALRGAVEQLAGQQPRTASFGSSSLGLASARARST